MKKEKRAKQIAKDTKLSIIDIEIEDWKNSIKDIQKKIKKLEEEYVNAYDKCELWKMAKIFKRRKTTK